LSPLSSHCLAVGTPNEVQWHEAIDFKCRFYSSAYIHIHTFLPATSKSPDDVWQPARTTNNCQATLKENTVVEVETPDQEGKKNEIPIKPDAGQAAREANVALADCRKIQDVGSRKFLPELAFKLNKWICTATKSSGRHI